MSLIFNTESQQAAVAALGADGAGKAVWYQDRILKYLWHSRAGSFGSAGLTIIAAVFLLDNAENCYLLKDIGEKTNRADEITIRAVGDKSKSQSQNKRQEMKKIIHQGWLQVPFKALKGVDVIVDGPGSDLSLNGGLDDDCPAKSNKSQESQ